MHCADQGCEESGSGQEADRLGDKSRDAILLAPNKINFIPANRKSETEAGLRVLKGANIIEIDDAWAGATGSAL